MGFLDKLFDPGKKDRRAGQQAAADATFTGGSTTGPGGITSGFDFSGKRGTTQFGLGSFDPLLQGLQQAGAAGLSQSQAGLPPHLQALFASAQEDLATPHLAHTDLGSTMGGLQQLFQSQLGTATADPFALGSSVSERLRALSERRNKNEVQNQLAQLQQSGRLGASFGVAEAFETQARQDRQGLEFDLAGLQAGQGIQQNALAALFGASQGIQNVGAQQFGQQLSGQQLLADFANARFNQGSLAHQLELAQKQQGFQQGTGAVQSAAGLSQLPLAFQNALLQAQGLKSDVDLGRATTNMQAASLAKSPLLEAVNTVGQFFSPIQFPGTGAAAGKAVLSDDPFAGQGGVLG
jgi:hypothetical protein